MDALFSRDLGLVKIGLLGESRNGMFSHTCMI